MKTEKEKWVFFEEQNWDMELTFHDEKYKASISGLDSFAINVRYFDLSDFANEQGETLKAKAKESRIDYSKFEYEVAINKRSWGKDAIQGENYTLTIEDDDTVETAQGKLFFFLRKIESEIKSGLSLETLP